MLPLIAVMQENKGKVRPVLDYRELKVLFVVKPLNDGARRAAI